MMKKFIQALSLSISMSLAAGCDSRIAPDQDPNEIGSIAGSESMAGTEPDYIANMAGEIAAGVESIAGVQVGGTDAGVGFWPEAGGTEAGATDAGVVAGSEMDLDSDNDGHDDAVDNCPEISNYNQSDIDADGLGDVCDSDIDGDGVLNDLDNCVLSANSDQSDLDNDGTGDVCDTDIDGDGIKNDFDNCVLVSNEDQLDSDMNGVGNACEEDLDGDGIRDEIDNCLVVPNLDQADDDMDMIGNACDLDADNDGVNDGLDNCPQTPNPAQGDIDNDQLGDVCDSDIDDDGVLNDSDNCVAVANANQIDVDADGIGNACDTCEHVSFTLEADYNETADNYLVGEDGRFYMHAMDVVADCDQPFVVDEQSLVDQLRALNPQIPVSRVIVDSSSELPVGQLTHGHGALITFVTAEETESPFRDNDGDGIVDTIQFPQEWSLNDGSAIASAALTTEAQKNIYQPMNIRFQVATSSAFTSHFHLGANTFRYALEPSVYLQTSPLRDLTDDYPSLVEEVFSVELGREATAGEHSFGFTPNSGLYVQNSPTGFCAFGMLQFLLAKNYYLNDFDDFRTYSFDWQGGFVNDRGVMWFLTFVEAMFVENDLSDASCGVTWSHLLVKDAAEGTLELPNFNTNRPLGIFLRNE
jgi:hypothetical protein